MNTKNEENEATYLYAEDLKNIVKGACFLGSGGGGGYSVGMQLAQGFEKNIGGYYPKSKVSLLSLDELKSSPAQYDYGVIVAYMGAPQKMAEIVLPTAPVAALQKILNMEKYKGKRFCIVPVEIGAISSLVACLTAVKLNLPVVDADGAGRAVPTLNLITFSTQGISVNPTLLASHKRSEKDFSTTIELNISGDTSSHAASQIESFARPTLGMAEFDQMGGLAMWVMDAAKIPQMVIANTLSLCKGLGKRFTTIQSFEDAGSEIIKFMHNAHFYKNDYHTEILCAGSIEAAETKTAQGFDFGTIKMNGKGGEKFTILFQNESLIIWNSNKERPLTMAPNLICYLINDGQKRQWVYSNDDIMENGKLKSEFREKEIVVLGLQAPFLLLETESHIEKLRNLLLQSELHSTNTNGDCEKVTLPENYMSLLHSLGYYGKYVPLDSVWGKE